MKRGLLVLLTIVMSCAPAFAQKVSTDYDPDYDFSAATTFSWGEGGTPPGNDLARKRLETAIIEAMKAEGLQFVDEGEVDLLVVYHAVVDQETKKSAVNVGVGVSKRISKKGAIRLGASTSGKTKTVEVGTLVIDLHDSTSGDLVWTATATDTLKGDPEARQAQVGSALKKAFDDYPPAG